MAYERLELTRRGPVTVLTLNHPEALNAVSLTMISELSQAADEVANDGTTRCLVMTGAGRGFCAGANLTDGRVADAAAPGQRDAGAVLESHYHPFLLRLRDLPFPFITAVNGPAAGVGMSFALMGDIVYAARSSYMLQAFARIGLVPDGGSTWLLPRLVGVRRAMELSLLAEKLPAEQALEWGLVNRVVEDADLMPEALKLAERLASGPTKSLSLIRKLYWDSPEQTYEDQLHLERVTQREAGLTEDFVEGVTAFTEKRPARFQGK